MPQGILLTLLVIDLILTAILHGQPRPRFNFWTALLEQAIVFALLIWGGFFK